MKADILSLRQLKQVVTAEQKSQMIIAVSIQGSSVIVITGDGQIKKISKSFFTPSGTGNCPDFDDVEVIDFGHGVRFGEYDAASDCIIENAK